MVKVEALAADIKAMRNIIKSLCGVLSYKEDQLREICTHKTSKVTYNQKEKCSAFSICDCCDKVLLTKRVNKMKEM